MTQDLIPIPSRKLTTAGSLPGPIARAGEKAAWRFVEFFTANIRNKNTRLAYAQAVSRFFAWCEEHGLELDNEDEVTPEDTIAGVKKAIRAKVLESYRNGLKAGPKPAAAPARPFSSTQRR